MNFYFDLCSWKKKLQAHFTCCCTNWCSCDCIVLICWNFWNLRSRGCCQCCRLISWNTHISHTFSNRLSYRLDECIAEIIGAAIQNFLWKYYVLLGVNSLESRIKKPTYWIISRLSQISFVDGIAYAPIPTENGPLLLWQ